MYITWTTTTASVMTMTITTATATATAKVIVTMIETIERREDKEKAQKAEDAGTRTVTSNQVSWKRLPSVALQPTQGKRRGSASKRGAALQRPR